MNFPHDDMLQGVCKIVAFSVSSTLATVPVFLASAGEQMSILSAEGWLQLALQAGSTFILAIFLLWVLPSQMRFQRELAKDMQEAIRSNNEANAKVVENLTGSFERHDTAWREILSKHGHCPVRDGGR